MRCVNLQGTLKIFVVTLLRITKKEGIVHHEPPLKLLL